MVDMKNWKMKTRDYFTNSEEIIRMGFAGGLIGLAGFAYLAVGGPIGAFLFSFGLIGIYAYQLILFTGVVGERNFSWQRLLWLSMVLLCNVSGALLVSLIAHLSPLDLTEKVSSILSARLSLDVFSLFLLSLLCGFIVDMAVYSWKIKGNILPTFLGVMVFVSCGFPHCIADAFYIGLGITSGLIKGTAVLILLLKYVFGVVFGNFVGCSIRRKFRLAQ